MFPNLDAGSRPFHIPHDRRRRRRDAGRLRDRIPHIETLEARVVLSATTDTWTGMGADTHWKTAGNWSSGLAPQAGDALVFPSGLSAGASYLAVNDFTAGTIFNSITIQGSGYQLQGNPVELTGGIAADYGSGTSTDSIATTLDGGTVSVGSGGELDMGGAIAGSAGLTLGGGGTLAMTGSAGNTYTGTTSVNSGTLALSIVGGGAIPGPLVVGDGTDAALVRETQSNQLGASVSVTVNPSGTFDLDGNSQTVGLLFLNGGSIATGAGTLTLSRGIFATGSSTTSTISGLLDLGGASRTFSVAGGDVLDISAAISGSGAGISKSGPGTLQLDGANTFSAGVTIAVGTVVANNATALGTGTATVNSGASLELTGGFTFANPLNIQGAGVSAGLPALFSTGGTTGSPETNIVSGAVTLAAASTIGADVDSTLTLSGAIGDGGGNHDLTVANTSGGTTIASATNTYGGATTVASGTLLVNGTIGGSGVQVAGGATVGGGGTAPGMTIASGATIRPGSAGSTAVLSTGSVAFDSGSTFDVEIDGPTVGTQYDSLDVTGTANLNADSAAGATLSLSLGSGDIPRPGTVYTVLSASGGVSGTFAGLADGSTVQAGGYPFVIHYLVTSVTLTAQARIDIWSGASGNHNWSSPNNWYDNTAPNTYDALVFPGNTYPTAQVNDLPAGMEFTSIEFDAYGLSISGNAIALDDGITTTYTIGTTNFRLPTTLNSDQTFTIAGGGTLDFHNVISGAHALTKAGAGTLKLDGSNTYTGHSTVGAGILEITNQNALGPDATNDVTVDSGAELELSSGSSIAVQLHSLTFSGTGVNLGGAIVSAGGANSLGGTTTLGADATIGVSAGSLAFLSPIGDGGGRFGVTTLGSGTLTYEGQNTYTGSTDVTAGSLELAAPAGGAIAGPLTIDASGSGSATVKELYNHQLTAATANVTLIGSGATFDLNGNSDTAASLTFTGGTVSTEGGTLTLGAGGVTTDGAGNTAQITGNLDLGAGTRTVTVARGTVSGGPDLSIAAVVGDGGLIKAGAGVLALSGANTYAGGTTIDDGIVQSTYDSALGSGAVAVDGSASLQLIGGTGGINVFNGLTLNSSSPAALEAVDGPCDVYGAIALGRSTRLAVDAGTMYLVGGVGDGGGSYSLTEAGGGVLVLQGSNTYGGGSTFAHGTVLIESAAATGTSGTVEVADGASLQIATPTYDLPSGGLQLDGGAVLASASSSAYTLSGGITLAGDATFEVDSTGSLLVSGAIGGGYGLTSASTGTLILTGTSAYTGATTVSGGVLQVDGSIATSSGLSLAGGAALTGRGSVPAVTAALGSAIQPGSAAAPATTGTISSGNVSLATNSNFNAYLEGTTAGTGYDQLDVTGTVDLDSDSSGGANLNVTLGFTPSLGDSFTLIANDGTDPIQGHFNGLPEGSVLTLNGQAFQLTYAGGPHHNSVVITDKATPAIAVDAAPNPSAFGQGVTFSVTVSGGGVTPTGTVTFYDGNPGSGGVPISSPQPLDGSGQAQISTSTLAAGSHQIYASYSGDGTYLPGTGMLSGGQDVTRDVTTTSLSSHQSSAVYGIQVIFTALVSQDLGGTPTGTVDFFDGATPIGSGTLNDIGIATLMTTALSVTGTPHTITATYEGSPTSLGSTSPDYSQTITPAALTIAANDVGKTYGDTTTFDGTEFTASGLANDDSVSSVDLSSPGAAATAVVAGSPYAITASSAVGSGLGNYTIAYVPGHLTVNPAPLIIAANNQARAFGAPNAPLTATYSGFVNGDTSVSLSTPLILTTPASSVSPAGAYAIFAAGATSTNYAITFRDGALAVAQAGSLTTLMMPGTPSVFGQSVSFAALVSPTPSVLTGVVAFFIDGAIAGSAAIDPGTGLATFTTTALGVGSHTIAASYAGNANFQASRSGAIQQAVNPAASQPVLTARAVRNRRGRIVAVSLGASILAAPPGGGTPSGTVTFFSGARNLGTISLAGGTAVVSARPGQVLNNVVRVQYNGDTNFRTSVSLKVKVTKQSIASAMARPFFRFARRTRRGG